MPPERASEGSLPRLVLASGSPYRARQLAALGLDFERSAPEVDETPRAGEAAEALARRLAVAKLRAVAAHPAPAPRIVVAGDQTATVETPSGPLRLGKPGTEARARDQLLACSGRTVSFWSAVAVLVEPRGTPRVAVDRTDVVFRTLDEGTVAEYVRLDRPLDCAGSFRAEGLGALLFEAVRTSDPHALTGLPLLTLHALLRAEGVDLLQRASPEIDPPSAATAD